MKCFCTDANYLCRECEQKSKWRKLDRMEKLSLLAYKEKLENNTVDIEDLKEIENMNLDVTMIPKKYYL